MCGISGLVGSSNRVYARNCVRKMNVALARRGPDAEGIDSWDRATLGHRRLDVMHRLAPAAAHWAGAGADSRRPGTGRPTHPAAAPDETAAPLRPDRGSSGTRFAD